MKPTTGLTVFIGSLVLLILHVPGVAQTPYHLEVSTNTGNDTLMVGVPGSVIFSVDSAGGVPAVTFTWSLVFDFSHVNFIGPLYDTSDVPNVTFIRPPSFWAKAVRKRHWATARDTAVVGTFYFKPPHWEGTGEQWRVAFTPTDTGRVTIDTAWSPPANVTSVLDTGVGAYPIAWTPHTIVVVPYCLTGDANADSLIQASDIIYLVNYVFRSGAAPEPCVAIGDANCSGTVTSADIIYIVTYVFRGGPRPCYACALVEQGIWTCP